MKHARIKTKYGSMEVELYEDDAPLTVENFCKLVEKGFYNGLIFHKMIKDFIVQTGCPKGDGTGDAGYRIKCETFGKKQQHDEGVLSMAHSGRDTGSSQFFICLNRKNTEQLDGNHTCFGIIKKGLEWIDNIKEGDLLEKIELYEPEE